MAFRAYMQLSTRVLCRRSVDLCVGLELYLGCMFEFKFY